MASRLGFRVTVVVVGVMLAAAGLYGTIEAFADSHPQLAGEAFTLGPAGPPVFADSRSTGEHTVLELRSANSGSVTTTLHAFGSSFTNNGLAFSPDDTSLFFTLIPGTKPRDSNLLIERISTLTRALTLIAHGEAPAVSPDGQQLAYVAGPHARSVAVRDLTTGRTRFIDLTGLVGDQADVFNGAVTWLSNGRQIALITNTTSPVRDARGRSETSPRPGACAATAVPVCLIVVDLSDDQPAITATAYALPDAFNVVNAISGDANSPQSILVAHLGPPDNAIIERITPHGRSLKLSQLDSIPAGQVVSFDPAGDRVLYLLGHSPPALWTATVTSSGLRTPRRLLRHPELEAEAW